MSTSLVPLHRARPRIAAAVSALGLALLAGLAGATEPAEAAAGNLNFIPQERYVGTFADPTVMRVGETYVAAATTTASLNLPVMTSTDLKTWHPRPALADYRRYVNWRHYNDAMPIKSSWAAATRRRDNVALMSQWAPSLAKVGDRYVAAYSAAVSLEPRKSCIGIASSSHPLGPYRDTRATSLTCFTKAPLGAIDPDVFVNPRSGRPFLLWKQEGIPNRQPPKLVVRRLDATGTAFAAGSRKTVLAVRDQAWEGGVVENPSMVRYGGRFYLFYAGNAWRSGDYATGYAICTTVRGPCTKPTRTPLLTSAGDAAGPGGADAFVDAEGRLRLLYHAWDAAPDGSLEPGALRRLHVATLGQRPDGLLEVEDHGHDG